MRVSIVQSRQFVDFEVEDYEKYPIEYFENIKRKTLYEICYLIEQAAKDHPDLIVTPEAVNAIIPSNKRTKFLNSSLTLSMVRQ